MIETIKELIKSNPHGASIVIAIIIWIPVMIREMIKESKEL